MTTRACVWTPQDSHSLSAAAKLPPSTTSGSSATHGREKHSGKGCRSHQLPLPHVPAEPKETADLVFVSEAKARSSSETVAATGPAKIRPPGCGGPTARGTGTSEGCFDGAWISPSALLRPSRALLPNPQLRGCVGVRSAPQPPWCRSPAQKATLHPRHSAASRSKSGEKLPLTSSQQSLFARVCHGPPQASASLKENPESDRTARNRPGLTS